MAQRCKLNVENVKTQQKWRGGTRTKQKRVSSSAKSCAAMQIRHAGMWLRGSQYTNVGDTGPFRSRRRRASSRTRGAQVRMAPGALAEERGSRRGTNSGPAGAGRPVSARAPAKENSVVSAVLHPFPLCSPCGFWFDWPSLPTDTSVSLFLARCCTVKLFKTEPWNWMIGKSTWNSTSVSASAPATTWATAITGAITSV